MTDLDKSNPQFTVALRGYDRIQVDGYIDRLQLLLDEAEQRTRTAEERVREAQERTPWEMLGPRLAQILELASAEADDLHSAAERDAAAVLSDAQAKAKGLIGTARRAADHVEERARGEHAELLGELAAQRDEIHAEVMLLERQRDELVAHLRRLYSAVGRLAAVAADAKELPDETTETHQLKAVVGG